MDDSVVVFTVFSVVVIFVVVIDSEVVAERCTVVVTTLVDV